MSSMAEEYVQLACPNCGGEIEVDEVTFDEHFADLGETAVYLGTMAQGTGARCQHCGARFEKKQQLQKAAAAWNIRVEQNIDVVAPGSSVVGLSIDSLESPEPIQPRPAPAQPGPEPASGLRGLIQRIFGR